MRKKWKILSAALVMLIVFVLPVFAQDGQEPLLSELGARRMEVGEPRVDGVRGFAHHSLPAPPAVQWVKQELEHQASEPGALRPAVTREPRVAPQGTGGFVPYWLPDPARGERGAGSAGNGNIPGSDGL